MCVRAFMRACMRGCGCQLLNCVWMSLETIDRVNVLEVQTTCFWVSQLRPHHYATSVGETTTTDCNVICGSREDFLQPYIYMQGSVYTTRRIYIV